MGELGGGFHFFSCDYNPSCQVFPELHNHPGDGVGFTVQLGAGVEAAMLVNGSGAVIFSALTRTGITPPVTRPKGR